MAQPPNSGITAVARGLSQFTVQRALHQAITDRSTFDYIASCLYQSEEQRNDWRSLTPAQRAIWMERTRAVIAALADRVGR